MKKILAIAVTTGNFAALILAYSPSTGEVDKYYLALLVPTLMFNVWAMISQE
ncbi:hypothetical protein [Cupriavidus basilensis]|uniref:hypothetical protein n=1 Tax=Cupriavidus basilensis TaxID=68895 RepID=UPI000B11161B|nr:hypothetical protein [Cupriavidus basilensis]